MLAGWINRHQQAVIAYQREEIKVLREMLGGKRLRFTDQHRRHLALRAQALNASSARSKRNASTASSRWVSRTCENSSASTSLTIMLSARIRGLAARLSSRPTITLQMAHWSGGSDSVACSTTTTEKPREFGTIQ